MKQEIQDGKWEVKSSYRSDFFYHVNMNKWECNCSSDSHIHRVHSIIYQKAQESAVPLDVLNDDYHICTSESDSEIETMSKIDITVPASKGISVCG